MLPTRPLPLQASKLCRRDVIFRLTIAKRFREDVDPTWTRPVQANKSSTRVHRPTM